MKTYEDPGRGSLVGVVGVLGVAGLSVSVTHTASSNTYIFDTVVILQRKYTVWVMIIEVLSFIVSIHAPLMSRIKYISLA